LARLGKPTLAMSEYVLDVPATHLSKKSFPS